MNFLFVGACDTAGSSIATRMYREGHHIAWLTDEPTLPLWGDKIHGKVFRSSITPKTCKQILEGEAADYLIFLTAPWREKTSRSKSAYGSLLSTLNVVLRTAAAAKTKRICLLSRDQLADDHLLNPELEELRAAERMAASFSKQNNMSLLILRMGLLFSDGITTATLVEQLIHDMTEGDVPRIPFTADSELDLLCASDLAEAFLRLVNLNTTGTHTVLTGSPVTARTLCTSVAHVAHYSGEIEYGGTQYLCDERSSDEIRLLTGWMPFYLFPEKGELFLQKSLSRKTMVQEEEEKRTWLQVLQSHSFVWATVQNFLLFAIAATISALTEDWSDLRYVDVRLLYVVIIAITFGMRQGLIATALACCSYAVSLLHSGIDLSYLLYNVGTWIPFIIYGVAGAFGGYWSDKKNDEYDTLQREKDELDQRYDLLKRLYREVVSLKNQLQKQIVVSKESFTRMYSIMSELDSTDQRMLMARTVRVAEQVMNCEGAAFYILAGKRHQWARLSVCSAAWSPNLQRSQDLTSMPTLYTRIMDGKIFVNTDLMAGYPSMAMPVMQGSTPKALVTIYNIPLENFTTDYENRFQTLVQMIQDYLVKALEYERKNRDRLFLPGTRIYNAKAFSKELGTLRTIDKEFGCPFSLGRLNCTDGATSLKALYKRAEPLLRSTDLIGVGPDGNVYVLFLYVDNSARTQLSARLASKGLSVTWED